MVRAQQHFGPRPLPLTGRGRNFYYGDYRVGGGMKVYNWDNFTCCSSTYSQNMADYYNLAYYKDAHSLYVNLYLPSDVTWQGPDGNVTVEQETLYPEAETSVITVKPARPSRFTLNFRVPSWTRGMSVAINGTRADVECKPGTWAVVDRTWTPGDKVEVTIPLTLRMEPVDRQHPDRVAVMRGPVGLILEGTYHAGAFRLPERDDDLATWLVPEKWSRPLAILSPGSEARHDERLPRRPARQERRAAEVPPVLRYRRRIPVIHVLRSKGAALQALVKDHGEREGRRAPWRSPWRRARPWSRTRAPCAQ